MVYCYWVGHPVSCIALRPNKLTAGILRSPKGYRDKVLNRIYSLITKVCVAWMLCLPTALCTIFLILAKRDKVFFDTKVFPVNDTLL